MIINVITWNITIRITKSGNFRKKQTPRICAIERILVTETIFTISENDTLWSYIFLNDSKEKLDSLWFKPNKIYLKKLNKQEVHCYKYNDFNEYSEVYIYNGIVVDMRFSLFKK